MLLPSSCLHFGPPQNLTVTAGTSQTDQAQYMKELKNWIEQQEATLEFLYWEEVEFLPLPLLLEEMEECFGETDWAALDFVLGRSRSSPFRASSKPCRPHHKRSTPAVAAAPAELGMPTAVPAEPSSPPPAAAEFPAEFSSWPGRRPRRRAAATGKVSTEGPPATAPSRLSSPEFVGGCPALGGCRSS
ncbi:hypothetical protein CRENBAI_008662 [Crenichthys baileyi]|uniref:Uncharacterized protein n=1 Tax=Crenichthys baileyi TaxID=28760 RepID=A0AAV9QNL1_9TELE